MWGRQLAHKDSNQPDIIRHFGLSLIENAVRYKWNDGSYSNQDRAQLRDSVVDLMKNVSRASGMHIGVIADG